MIYISVGSNIGNRFSHLQRAAQLLKERYFKDLKSSIILETKAILPNGAPPEWDKPFLNMIVYGSCSSSPEELLKAQTDKICQKIKKLFILYFLNIISHGSASAVIAEIDNGALSARVKAWFWVERSNHWWSLIMTTPRRRLYNLTVPS